MTSQMLLLVKKEQNGAKCVNEPVVQHLGGEGKGDPELKTSAAW